MYEMPTMKTQNTHISSMPLIEMLLLIAHTKTKDKKE